MNPAVPVGVTPSMEPATLAASRLLDGGRAGEAIAAFELILCQRPGDADALFGLARAQLAAQRPDLAEPLLKRLVVAHPDHREGRSHLSLLRAHHGDPSALHDLQQLSDAPGAGFLEHYNLSTALLELEDLAGAEAAARKALAAEPDHPSGHARLGEIALERSDPRAAAGHFERVVAKMPAESVGWVLLAQARALAGQWEQALLTLERALLHLPGSPGVLECLHGLALRSGDGQRALRASVALRQLDPESADAAYRLGRAALVAGHIVLARDGFAEAVELAPAAWMARQGLAKVCAALGEMDRAVAELEKALELCPGQPDLANDLAALWLRRSVPARAEPVLRRALEARPDEPGLHLHLALALGMLGREREALVHAERAAAAEQPEIAGQGAQLRARLLRRQAA